MSPSLQAAPRVIQDNRLTHLVGTPTLGRGYSQNSNQLKSVCFEKVAGGRPTLDFEFEIEEIDQRFLGSLLERDSSRLKGQHFDEFLRKHIEGTDGADQRPKRSLIAHVTVDSYYKYLDETISPLSPHVRRLLKDKRYATFFSSCGFFYIRSVRTFSSYIALLRFDKTSDKKGDDVFINLIKQGVLSFGANSELSADQQEKLIEESESRNLQVLTVGIGLSKGKFVNLVPVSISQFRSTIQSAVGLMQDEHAGVVTSIEIAPWIENPEVDMLIGEGFENDGDSFSRLHHLESNAQIISYISEYRDYRLDQFYSARLCLEHLNTNYPALDPKVLARNERVVDPKRTMFRNLAAPNNKDLFVSLEAFREHFERFPPNHIIEENRRYLKGSKANDLLPQVVLKRGAKSSQVVRLQDALVRLGFMSKEDQVLGRGFFGPRTERSLVAFQKSVGLKKAHWGTFNDSTRTAMDSIKVSGAYTCIEKLHSAGLARAEFSEIPSCKNALNVTVSVDRFLNEYCLPTPVQVHYRKFDW
ncbi:MAG: peptidoglycan-binding protein [Myxococcota bacterium]|nr:peptidoglycan-binding protein [Myxococcota bacterium]